MTIEELYFKEDLSTRSLNLCINNGILTLTDLVSYYHNNAKSFKTLKNCGERSNEELTSICIQYSKKKISNNDHILVEEEMLQNLTRTQREVINSFIFTNTNSLSARSKNAISQFLDYNFSVRNFAEKILLDNHFNVAHIDNVGQKSIPEIEIYISIVNDFIIDVSESNDEKQLITLKNTFLIQRTFSISKIPTEILQSESIFQLTDFLLKNNALFNENQNLIIRKSLKIYQNEKQQSLDEIALENNLSKERVRQIRKDCVNELFEKLSFIRNFNDDLFQNYGIDLSSNLIEIKENLVDKINLLNKTKFSKEFASYILAVYLSSNFLVIGNIEDVLQTNSFSSKNRHNWNNFYIVNRELSSVDFVSFANDIHERLNERIEETYSFNFKSYLSRFINDLDIETIELIFSAAEKIINDEFSLYLDLDDNIVFKRNTVKQVYEYAVDALRLLNKPSKVEEIYHIINQLDNSITKSADALRGSLRKKNNGIIYFGRESTYGLETWELERNNIRGGTIKDIAREYLLQFETPIHIEDITSYVLNYRENTNEKSIYYNMKIDPQKSFIFFEGRLIGLKEKKYATFYLRQETKKIVKKQWCERYQEIKEFMKINQRFPLSESGTEEESTLYRWFNIQKDRIRKGKLTQEKIELFEALVTLRKRYDENKR